MDTAPKMEDIAPSYIRIRPNLRLRLDAYLHRNPHVKKTDVLNNGLELELSRREALEPKPVEVAA